MIWLVRTACVALYPPTDSLPGVSPVSLTPFLKKFKQESSMLLWVGVVAGAFAFALTPLLTLGIPLPAFLLPKGLLEKHAYKVASHPIYLVRQSVFLLKMVAGMCWGSSPEVRKQMALDPYGEDPGTWRK